VPSDEGLAAVRVQLSNADVRLFREAGYSRNYLRFSVATEGDAALVMDLVRRRAHDSTW
jgi:hypothetical protein